MLEMGVEYAIIKFIIRMDFVRSPWKQPQLYDPVLTLASHARASHPAITADRFCPDYLPSSILLNPEKQENLDADKNTSIQSELKKKNYLGLLTQACGMQSSRMIKKHKQQSSAYTSIIKRPGYLMEQPEIELECPKLARKISKQPYRILNAPKLKDDFYTSLLDWSPDDLVSVVLNNAAYVWSSKEQQTEKMIQGFISSIKWGKGLVIGEQTGRMRVVDVEKKRQSAKFKLHDGRVGTIDCFGHLIASGSKDNTVMIWDVRSKSAVGRYEAHRQEVCGVKWSFDGNMVASGGNDNAISIWDMRTSKIYTKFNEHKAAVKALAWSPHQTSILATGGGSTDKCIKIWNTNEKKCVKTVQTGSQVCNMTYSVNSHELVSTHGFSFNSINIWNTKDMEKVGTLTGHAYRVLYLARSPDGQSIITGSGDETLRFWKVFPSSSDFKSYSSSLQLKNSHLR